MSDLFLVLAQLDEGSPASSSRGCCPTAAATSSALQRLKDKLGDRSNASSEVEFDGTTGWLVGEPGRGVPAIIEMVATTRLDCVLGSAATVRAALTQAVAPRPAPAGLRRPAGRPAADAERAGRPGGGERGGHRAGGAAGRGPGRRGVGPSCGWPARPRSSGSASARPGVVAEAMEVLGGNGYVEESGLPRLYRQAPLNSIWEGSGNVIALDVLRAMGRSSDIPGRGQRRDRAGPRRRRPVRRRGQAAARRAGRPRRSCPLRARRIAGLLALCLQGSLLLRHAPARGRRRLLRHPPGRRLGRRPRHPAPRRGDRRDRRAGPVDGCVTRPRLRLPSGGRPGDADRPGRPSRCRARRRRGDRRGGQESGHGAIRRPRPDDGAGRPRAPAFRTPSSTSTTTGSSPTLNAAAEQMLGRGRATCSGRSFQDAFPTAAVGLLEQTLAEVLRDGRPRVVEYLHEPWQHWFEIRVYPDVTAGSPSSSATSTSAHRADRAACEAELRGADRRHRLAARGHRDRRRGRPDPVGQQGLDGERRAARASPASCRAGSVTSTWTACPAGSTARTTPRSSTGLDKLRARQPSRGASSTTTTRPGWASTPAGSACRPPGSARPSAIVVSHIDVTDRVLSEQALAWQAGHDDLTGLPNRSLLLHADRRRARPAAGRRRPGRAAGARPRRLQDGQRLPRPRARRPAARQVGRAAARAGPARGRRRPARRRPVRRPGARAATAPRRRRWPSGCRRRSRCPSPPRGISRAAVGEHRRRRLPARRPHRPPAAQRRRRRDVRRQELRPRPGAPVLPGAARGGPLAAGGGQPAARGRDRPARRPLPAGGAAGHRRGRGRRGAGPLAAPRARPAAAGRLPRRRRGDRPGHPDHPLAAARDHPAGRRVGRAGAAAADVGQRQRPALLRRDAGPRRAGGPARLRPAAGPARARADRDQRRRGPDPRRGPAHRAAQLRRPGGDRRLRHRLVVAGPAVRPAHRHAQDRPLAAERRRAGRRPARPGRCWPRSSALTRTLGIRSVAEGVETAEHLRDGARRRLRPGPGLAARAADAGRRGPGLGARGAGRRAATSCAQARARARGGRRVVGRAPRRRARAGRATRAGGAAPAARRREPARQTAPVSEQP